MISTKETSLTLISSALEEIRYDKRDLSTPDPNDWIWMDSERVESFRWSINNESEITISISLDIPQNRTDLSRSVALSFASIPHQIRGSQKYGIAVDDRDGGYYGEAFNKVILGYEETLRNLADGFLEELLTHEVAHAELDKYLYYTSGWANAVSQDSGRFISKYAGDYPSSEDVAETVLPLAAILSADPTELTAEDKAYLLASASWVPGRYAYMSQQIFGTSGNLSQRLASLQDPITGGSSQYSLSEDSITRISEFDVNDGMLEVPDNLSGKLRGSSLYAVSAPTTPGAEGTKQEWMRYKNALKKTKTLEKKIGRTGDAFSYKQSTGEFFVDTNGKQKGFGEGGLLAILENQPLLTLENILF
jgi:hypothetical protein